MEYILIIGLIICVSIIIAIIVVISSQKPSEKVPTPVQEQETRILKLTPVTSETLKPFSSSDTIRMSSLKKLNESCSKNSDCDGFLPGQNTLACDKGTCQQQLKDWAGVYYSPSECRDAPAPLGYPGSCKDRNHHWKRKLGESCDTHIACDGYMPLQNTLTCDTGTCKQAKKDWIGVYYSPSECVGKAFGPKGICI